MKIDLKKMLSLKTPAAGAPKVGAPIEPPVIKEPNSPAIISEIV